MAKFKIFYPLTLMIVVGASIFLLELVLVSGLKYGFSDFIQLAIAALSSCGMLFSILFICGWIYHSLAIQLSGIEPSDKQLGFARFGTYCFVGLVEVFIFSTLPHMNSTYSLIILYIPIIAIICLLIQFLTMQVLELRKKS